MPQLAFNKRALFDYVILEKFEAGLVLFGHEVKSVRSGKMSLLGAYVTIGRGSAWLINAHVPLYPKAGQKPDYDPDRTRRLLLHKRELDRLSGKLDQKGLTLVPISVYTKGSRIKIEFGLGRGKKQFEKKETIKKREVDREIRRSLKA
jgi:SsrA-binding protein